MENKKRILFLINPKSGVQKKKDIPGLVEKYLDKNKFDFSVEFTQYMGHAAELAKDAVKDGVDVVVAVGGDGTINEVGSSLVHTNTALGVIPCGSGNGFARHLGIPVDVHKSIEFINNSSIVSVDYGKLNGRPFFCSCGVGFDAAVSCNFAKGKRRGLLSYVQNTLMEYLSYKPEEYEVELFGTKKCYKAFLIACGNASQYGNNAYITPYASMRDGLLNVSILTPFVPVEAPVIAAQLFSNNVDLNGRVVTLSTPWVKIKRKTSGPAHYDGEPSIMEAELLVEVVPSGIKVLACENWDGTCEPLPLYRQFYDVVAGCIK